MRRVYVVLFGLAVLEGCEDSRRQCEPPPPAPLGMLPERLSETGITDPGVRPFEPRFQLWSDGASKRRWIHLPAGSSIDTSDPDDWRFPVGTKLWKEFTRDGVRVETRLLERYGEADDEWTAVAYVWNAAGTEATKAPDGVANARGTGHDVPPASMCFACHGGRRSRVLGYSAVQLGRVEVPGNETERSALGYLHANCGHCHNQERPARDGARCFDPRNALDMWLRVDRLGAPSDTPAYATLLGAVVRPGDPDRSRLVRRFTSSDSDVRMPPLGTERIDAAGAELLRSWISGLR